jgi:hypothetical protein
MARMKGVTAEVSYDRKPEDDEGLASARELVGKESADLWGRVKRMSVRDLASKFESGQAAANAAAARLSQEVVAEIFIAYNVCKNMRGQTLFEFERGIEP